MSGVFDGSERGTEAGIPAPLWALLPVALLGGLVTTVGFPASDLAPLALIGVALGLGTFGAARTATRGAVAGFVYGLGFAGVLFSWALELELVAYLALAVIQAGYWALSGAALARAGQRLGPFGWVLAGAAVWTLVEALRARFPLGGFEWGQLGLATADLPIRAAAAVVGTLGVTGLLVGIAAGAVVALRTWGSIGPLRATAPLLLTVAVTAGTTYVGAQGWTEPTGELEVAIAQVDDPCPGEYAADCPGLRDLLLEALADRTEEIDEDPDLLMWGEGVLRGETPAHAGAEATAVMGELPSPLLAGTISPLGHRHFYNRNVLYDDEGAVVDAYAKQHPVPFGEWVPLRAMLGGIGDVGRLVPTDMVRGSGPGRIQLPDQDGDIALGTVVSWEVTFARLVRGASRDADALTTLTTQASYGESPVSDQLLQASQLRSAETGRALAVAATTGRSTIIEPGGERLATTALFAADTLTGTLELRDGETPFMRLGEWPIIGFALVIVLIGVVRARSRSA